MSDHVKKPVPIRKRFGNINQPPLSSRLWYPTIDAMQYIRNWIPKDLFWFSGPGPNQTDTANNPNPRSDATESAFYYIILHTPAKADTSKPKRQLGGYLLPWAFEGSGGPNSYDNNAKIIWTPPDLINTVYASDIVLWEAAHAYPSNIDQDAVTPVPHASNHESPNFGHVIQLYNNDNGKFRWTPESAGGFSFGCIETRQINTAALTIAEMPENPRRLTGDQQLVRRRDMAPQSFVFGHGTGYPASYGTLVHNIGNGDTLGSGVQDSCLNNAMHCLYQSGTPTPIITNSAAYVNIHSDASYLRVSAPNFSGSDGTIEVYPAAVLAGANLNVGPAGSGYLRLTSKSTADTWVVEIDNDNLALYSDADGSQASLTINIDSTPEDNFDDILVEMKVDNGGAADYAFLHSLSLWCGDPITYTA